MRILFSEGVVREVMTAEVVPMDIGDGEIAGTQINFTLATGDSISYIYSQNISMEDAGQRAIDFIHSLYDKGYADFTQEPVEIL